MNTMASQFTDVSIICPTVCSGADKKKHQSSASLAFVRGIRQPVAPLTKIQQRGKCFHLVTTSCSRVVNIHFRIRVLPVPHFLGLAIFIFLDNQHRTRWKWHVMAKKMSECNSLYQPDSQTNFDFQIIKKPIHDYFKWTSFRLWIIISRGHHLIVGVKLHLKAITC